MSYSFVFLNGEDAVTEECLNLISDLGIKLMDLRIMSNDQKYISKSILFQKKPIVIEKFNKENFNPNEFDIIFIKELPENINNEQIQIEDILEKINNKTFHGRVIYHGYNSDVKNLSDKIDQIASPISISISKIVEIVSKKSEIKSINIFGNLSLGYLGRKGMDILFKDTKKFFESTILENLGKDKKKEEKNIFNHDTSFTTLNDIILLNSQTNLGVFFENEIFNSINCTDRINFDFIQIPTFRVDGLYITIEVSENFDEFIIENMLKSSDLFNVVISDKSKSSSRENVEKDRISIYKISRAGNLINIYINFDHIGILARFIAEKMFSIVNE